jgi:NAD(P)-dependent dehydrogenase (short-subunit alcohol dehydrogenase family)
MLEGKHALIFAAYGAVSSAVAKRLVDLGATVHLSGRDTNQLQQLADEIESKKGKATIAVVDACDEASISRYVEAIAAEYSIDFAFNGIGPRAADANYGLFSTDLSYEKFMLSLETIVGSQFLTARAIAPHMAKAEAGSIVLLSSTLRTSFIPMMAGITAACGAVEALTQTLAAEFGPMGTRVNCVRPTAMPNTRTIRETNEQIQKTIGQQSSSNGPSTSGVLKREITTADTAGVVAYLCSPLSDPISGQVFNVCGGQFLS